MRQFTECALNIYNRYLKYMASCPIQGPTLATWYYKFKIPTRTVLHDSNHSFFLFMICVTLWNSVYLTFANKVAYTWPRTFCTTKLKLAVWTFKRSGNSLLRYVSQSFNCSHLLSGAELIFPYAGDATYNLRINNSSMLELVWTWRHSNMFNVEQ